MDICALTLKGMTDSDKEKFSMMTNDGNYLISQKFSKKTKKNQTILGVMGPMMQDIKYFIWLAVVAWLTGWIQTGGLMNTALRFIFFMFLIKTQ